MCQPFQSEELEQLLDPRPHTTTTPVPTLDRDSGCSPTPPPAEEEEEEEEGADDFSDEICCLMEGRAAWVPAETAPVTEATCVRNSVVTGMEERETTC